MSSGPYTAGVHMGSHVAVVAGHPSACRPHKRLPDTGIGLRSRLAGIAEAGYPVV